MNSFSDSHEPTPEFRARIKHEISRAVRSDHLSAMPTAPVRTRRLATMVGIAAGVVLTLMAGMVLGASASYASAAVLDEHQREANTSVLAATRRLIAGQLTLARTNYDRVHASFEKGTASQGALDVAAAQVDTLQRTIAQIEIGLSASRAATPPARSALAILPIKNALNALGCAPASSTQQAPVVAAAAPEPQPVTTAQRQDPDRARIIALATEHLPSVVRGDSTAEYIVMVFDASDRYAWSTFGSGNLSLQIAGDPRTAQERVAYMRDHSTEYGGASANAFAFSPLELYGNITIDRFKADSLGGDFQLRTRRLNDSNAVKRYLIALDTLVMRAGAARGSGARGGGARGGGADSGRILIREDPRMMKIVQGDSLFRLYAGGYAYAVTDGRGGRGFDRAALPSGVSPVNAPDGSYTIGWNARRATVSNAATGLEESGNGQSGIQGVASRSISMGESYVFPPGELAPQMLRVVVVHLAPGMVWKGR